MIHVARHIESFSPLNWLESGLKEIKRACLNEHSDFSLGKSGTNDFMFYRCMDMIKQRSIRHPRTYPIFICCFSHSPLLYF